MRVVKEQVEVEAANVWRFYRSLEVSQYRALCLITIAQIDSNYIEYEGVDGRTLMDESRLSQNAIRTRRVGQRAVGV